MHLTFQRFTYLLLFVLSFVVKSNAQQTQYVVTGTVTDSLNNEPLGFVTVVFNGNGTLGTTTSAFGKYEFRNNAPVNTLTCSFIGYNTKTIKLNSNLKTQDVNIQLVPSQYNLQNVVISSGENPANRIVRRVVANREQNDPDKLDAYAYTAYNKFIYSGVPPAINKKTQDTSGLYKFLEEHYLFILESVVETKFKKGEQRKERVLGNKISGLQDPSFSLMNTQIQQLSMYTGFIDILSKQYVNPFSKGSTERYFFNVEDTIYEGADTIFRMSFKPWKGRNFDGLLGMAEIHTDGYAIKTITAEPADSLSAPMRVRIQQDYSKINNERWFPTRFVSDIRFSNMAADGFQVMMHGVTTLTDVKLNPEIENKELLGVQVEMLPDAGDRDEMFWNKFRPDSLSKRELRTYEFLDSIGRSKHLDAKMRFAESLIDGELRFKYFNFNVSRFLWMNDLEGVRPGIGLRTNERVFKNISIGGFAGYGIKDERWKYGGELRLRLYQRNDVYLKFNYWKDLEESGAAAFYKDEDIFSSEIFRSFLVNSFDFVERRQVDFVGRTLQFLHYDVSAFTAAKESTTDYRFVRSVSGEPQLFDHYNFTGVKVALRYAYKEKMVQALRNTFFVGSDYPILFFQATQGFNGLMDGEFEYTKLEAKVKYDFSTKALGHIYLQVAAGRVFGELPLSDLFAGRGSYQIIGMYSSNSFQTMRLNEFYSDRYVNFFYEHDLKTLLFRGKKFQPKPLLVFNAGFGMMANKTQHRYLDDLTKSVKTMEKGFYETGLIVNDLISKEYLGVARIGLGAGAFYRFGPYELPEPIDNFAFKLDFNFNF